MQRRVRFLGGVVLLLGAAAVLAWLLSDPQPSFEGKRLSAWLSDYSRGAMTGVPELIQARRQAEVAVRQMGTNCIPTLLRMLGKKDSFAMARLNHFWELNHFSLPHWLQYPPWYRNAAPVMNRLGEQGFAILGSDAQSAVPALVALYQRNISGLSQSSTSRALIAIGPAAQRTAIPVFVRAASSRDPAQHRVAIWALMEVDPREAGQPGVVPALVNALGDTNFMTRMVATRGLGHFGTNAQSAVPALLRRLNDPDRRVRVDVTNALRKIDAEAAAKAGAR